MPQSVKIDLLQLQKKFSRQMEEEAQRQVKDSKILSTDNPADFLLGLIMSMHLFNGPSTVSRSSSDLSTQLQLICAYESGTVTQWRFSAKDKLTSVEGIGWEAVWTVKLHVETGMF